MYFHYSIYNYIRTPLSERFFYDYVWGVGGSGQAIEGCLASAIAFSEPLTEPYYIFLKHKHVYK